MNNAVRRFALATLVASFGLMVACGSSSPDSEDQAASAIGADLDSCVDRDGDGFGENCAEGADCDDTDDTVFEQCGVCFDTAEGCECDPGTEPVQCTVVSDVDTNLCKTGLRSCRDGKWTGCEGIVQFE